MAASEAEPHPHAVLLEKFYSSFQRRDYLGMAECYAPDACFRDSVYLELRGDKINAMWQMLCERAADFSLQYGAIEADDNVGRAHWEARYQFTFTGNKVHNRVDAYFEFKDGKIVLHEDKFNFYCWIAQALGLKGKLLGWMPLVQRKVRQQAARMLDVFILGKAANQSRS